MGENRSSFEGAFRNLPAQYQAWYNSRILFFDQNEPDGMGISSNTNSSNEWPSSETLSQPEPTTDNFALPSMPSFESVSMPSNASRRLFSQEQTEENAGDNFESAENSTGNLNSWNYLYYLQLLNEVERERRSSQVSVASVESQETDNSLNENGLSHDKPTESYSEKLKKGLGSDSNLSKEKYQFFGLPSQVFLTPETKDAKSETFKPRNSSAPKTVTKKSSKKKSNKETDFNTNDESLFGNSGANLNSSQNKGNYCEACKSPFAALNNTLPGNSCPSGIKCPLNVNNLHKKGKPEERPAEEEETEKEKMNSTQPENSSSKDRDKKFSQSAKNKKNKSKNVLNGTRKDSFDDLDGEVDNKAKRKGFPVKRSQRDRGKLPRHSGSRKRHANENEKESFLDHFSTIYSVVWAAISQCPSQPWFKYIMDNVVSLFGVVVGSLCVFAMIAFEGFKAFKTLFSSHFGKGFEWIKLHSLSIAHTIFLRTPGLSGYATKAATNLTENSNFEKLPSSGGEAVERLLKLKGQDPYLILGITPSCSDEDVKRRYKNQAVLVHPDKNNFPGAEEAFKVLASAFEILGNPDKRAEFDKENNIRQEGNEEMASFLERIQKNIEEIQSILGCRSCGKSHKRYKTEKQADNARYCASCKTHHAARLGDLWAETTMFGFKWHYFAYLDNAIYDVTEWVTCQTDLMATVEANTHAVPCRLATPKNKSRTSAHSRMEDLKDLVNDLLSKSRQGKPETAFTTTNDNNKKSENPTEAKSKARRQGGAAAGRRRK